MGELGRISGTFHSGAEPLGQMRKLISASAEMIPTMGNDDDAAVASIRNAHRADAANGRRSISGADRAATWAEKLRDFVEAVRESVTELRELVEQIASGRFSGGNLARSLREQAEAIGSSLDALWEHVSGAGMSASGLPRQGSAAPVYTDVGELLTRFREETEQINSFDGFLLGVHEKIDQFSEPVEFGLGHVQDVEQHMAETNAKLELGIFSLARVRERAMKALRCQDIEPERVLFLLQDDVLKPDTNGR